MTCKIISSGSSGNSVLYGSILVDCGVPYSKIKSEKDNIRIILLTHSHKDHINIKTIKSLQLAHPSIRVGCGKWMLEHLQGVNNIDVYDLGKWYNYGSFKVSPIKLYHDVENYGYRIFIGDCKIIHATDTMHLDGIEAKGYDLYAIESNYDEEKVQEAIKRSKETGEFTHAHGSIMSHLSHRQAWDFIRENKKETSKVILLHQSNHFK